MLDDMMELEKAKQITSAEKQVSWLIWGGWRLEEIKSLRIKGTPAAENKSSGDGEVGGIWMLLKLI